MNGWACVVLVWFIVEGISLHAFLHTVTFRTFGRIASVLTLGAIRCCNKKEKYPWKSV